jgi:hypothetical protein
MKTSFGGSRCQEAQSKNLLNTRPHPDPLPRGDGTTIASFAICECLFGKSSHMESLETVNVSPSPWGEGPG